MRIRYTPDWLETVGRHELDGERETDMKLGGPFRVRTVGDAAWLRLEYEACMTETTRVVSLDRKRALPAAAAVRNGQPIYRIYGIVTRAAFDHGRLSRVMLSRPKVCGPDATVTPLDTHFWLLVGRLRPEPDRMEPLSGLHGDRLTVNLGDTLYVEAALRAYDDKRGRHRLGVDWWTPVRSQLEYFEIQRTRSVNRVVPRNTCGQLALLHMATDGSWAGTGEDEWNKEYSALKVRLGNEITTSVTSIPAWL